MDINTPVLHLPSGRSGIVRAPRPGRDIEPGRVRVEWDNGNPAHSSIIPVTMLEERPHPPCRECLNPLTFDPELNTWLHQDDAPELANHKPSVRPWPMS